MSEIPLVFISYARKDRETADRVVSGLRSLGYDVWIDRNILGGKQWRAEIERGIRHSFAEIILLSPDSISSEWVRQEFDLAQEFGLLIAPILGAECSIPDYLEPYQCNTGFLESGFDAGMPELQRTLVGYLLETRNEVPREIKGYVYWFIDDLLYTMQQLLDNGTKEAIVRGFRQVNQKAKRLNLYREIAEEWADLKSQVGVSDDLTSQARSDFASDIRNLFVHRAEEAASHQPEFDAGEG